jgi:glycosyltransferase involved in cell wall biosynthesis
MIKKPIFSIIIPVRNINPYLEETLKKIKNQTLKSYEILVITDKISLESGASIHQMGPSFKRNLGAKKAKGEYLAFLDDDSYPDKNWLKNAFQIIKNSPNTAAVCGPCLTPPKDNIKQKASGLVWSSIFGSGGAGVYRNSIKSSRLVDDYPTVNLVVNKKDFLKVGGFNNHYWPGEDTILCMDLTKKLCKRIVYDPSIIVFHHRRSAIIPHLQQITRYAIHRGHFAKKFPTTSFRIGYLIPSFFVFYLVTFLFINLYYYLNSLSIDRLLFFYNLPIFFYISMLFVSFFEFIFKKNSVGSSILAAITIPITHVYYGLLFIYGFLKKDLQFIPHEVDKKTGKYIGG